MNSRTIPSRVVAELVRGEALGIPCLRSVWGITGRSLNDRGLVLSIFDQPTSIYGVFPLLAVSVDFLGNSEHVTADAGLTEAALEPLLDERSGGDRL